jgi:hypothetical protein
MLTKILNIAWMALLLLPLSSLAAESSDASALVENSFKYIRGKASIATVNMTIHRPDWERQMTIKTWTRGKKDSLFYIQSQGSRQRYLEKVTRDVDVQPQNQSCHQGAAVNDVPVMDGI